MNKRIYFILFPALAIILSIICRNDNTVFFKGPVHDLSISQNITQAGFPFSPGVKKENKSRLKNAIRIKARHDVVTINFFPASDACLPFFPSQRVLIYGGYRVGELSAHFSTSGLRGPPVA